MGKHIHVFIKLDIPAEDRGTSTVTSVVSVFTSYVRALHFFVSYNEEIIQYLIINCLS